MIKLQAESPLSKSLKQSGEEWWSLRDGLPKGEIPQKERYTSSCCLPLLYSYFVTWEASNQEWKVNQSRSREIWQ